MGGFYVYFFNSSSKLHKFSLTNTHCLCDHRESFQKRCNAYKENLRGRYLLTSVSDKHPITAMAFASHAVSKSDVDFELHLFNKS